MRAFLMNGGPTGMVGEDATAEVEAVLRRQLLEHGYAVDVARLAQVPVAYCRGCFECWTRRPGLCRTDDAARDIARRFILSDVVVFLTPITFGGYSSELKKALDRSIGLVSPFFGRVDGETRHRKRYDRYPTLLAVGLLPGPDPEDEALFRSLVRRNAVNMHAPAQAAEIIYRDEDPDKVSRRVDALIESVMVTVAVTA
jgi:multimeric flavodoxin WrbA